MEHGFLDEAIIKVKSGDGGKGCISFRREKYVPRGGPDGGDGGNGGNIVVRASKKLLTLSTYRSQKYFKAKNGQPGRTKNKTGKNGADIVIEVPLGTTIRDYDSGKLLADIVSDHQDFLIIPGGMGGKGNRHFASATNRTPKVAQDGLPGQELTFHLILKLLADIGLIGFPNAGKSTLLSRLTKAHPKIDCYPFTTLHPNLGMMTLSHDKSFVIADIPGLIEGASEGRGLGYRFLKHIERTRFLLHLVDINHASHHDILNDFHALRHEMAAFNPSLTKKPFFVLLNKIDSYNPSYGILETVKNELKRKGIEYVCISALTGKGINDLKMKLLTKWKEIEKSG